ncbi:hypothetical protein QJS04_geneDACA000988 [Acorus gramineus]|uniref:Uncharacterized protein n=1 Tax=Acorus gramineus TaxID=55184 RepID=A0AAV9AEE9_ACOGR|nr:hypothetical protein QJS04_geneDACA000988 [Acorus gramineus]
MERMLYTLSFITLNSLLMQTKYCSPSSVNSMRASTNLTRPNNNSTVSVCVYNESWFLDGWKEEEEDELKKKMKTWSLRSRSEPRRRSRGRRRRSKETLRLRWAEEEEEQAGTGFKKSNRSNISWKCSCIETL